MDPSWIDHVFLISCFHYIIVICLPVSMETLSTSTETLRGVPGESVDLDEDLLLIERFMDAPCPPKNYLHLICDVNIGSETICSHRALIIERCLYRFHLIYRNSSWHTCLTDANFCRKTIQVLLRENLIKRAALIDTKYYRTTPTDNTDTNSVSSIKYSLENRTSTSLLPSTSTPIYSTQHFVSTNNIPVTQEVTSYFTRTTKNHSSTMDSDLNGTSDKALPSISYVFPIIGSMFILLEVVALCAFSCYRRKKGTHSKTNRRPLANSAAVQEEAIQALNATPVKSSTISNHLTTEEEVATEDKDIFKSYMNLRYIDESEEPTPARRLLRL